MILTLSVGCTAPKSPLDLLKRASRATFKLVNTSGTSGGTAFHIEWKGKTVLMTNAHVCALADSEGRMVAQKDNMKVMYVVSVLKLDKIADLCILTPIPGYKGIPVSQKESALTDTVYSGGHPFLGPFTFKKGLVSLDADIEIPTEAASEEECKAEKGEWIYANFGFFSRTFCMVKHQALWSDLDVHPGCSGSAVLDSQGYVTGVVFAGGYSLSYYVPNRVLREFLSGSESLILSQDPPALQR